LYGKTIAVELIDWVREQRKFDGVESLKNQIDDDLRYIRDRMDLQESRAIAAA
jgi:riboflavin kinase/FMN adenylyltransferase